LFSTSHARILALSACAAAGVVAIAGCGGSDEVEASKLALSITEQGKTASFEAPKSAEGGLTDVTLTNKTKDTRDGQLVLIEGNHTTQDALKIIGGNSNKTPEWIRALGGPGSVPAGQTATTTANLPAGKYVVVDTSQAGTSGGPPPTSEIKVGSGEEGDLPSTDNTVVADEVGKDKFKWEGLDGLTAGKNKITFDSKGKDALHHIVAIPMTGKATVAELEKGLASNDPKTPLDFDKITGTSVIDGGKEEVTNLDLKSGTNYAFLCFLTDRDGGKSHFEEGLLAEQEIK
jgi:hypothetical protein